MANKIIILFLFIFIIVGFSDATYLTWAHYSGAYLQCTIWDGCDKVTSSEYSVWFGIPLALAGMIYYAGMLFFMLVYAVEKHLGALKAVFGMNIVGLAGSVYFVYLQIAVINAICFYCMISALDTTLIFILISLYFRRMHRKPI